MSPEGVEPTKKISELIVALDGKSREESIRLIDELANIQEKVQGRVNIIVKFNDLMADMSLQDIADMMRQYPALKVFLDPKWHDIEPTNANFVKRLIASGLASQVRYLTMHPETFAVPGSYEKSIASLLKDFPHLRTLAITFLTTLGDEEARRTHGKPVIPVVLDNAHMALERGFGGTISSAQEALLLRKVFEGTHPDFSIVTPGIRFRGRDAGDQKRVTEPADAFRDGVTGVVMGSDILKYPEGMEAAILRFASEVEEVVFEDRPVDGIDVGLERLVREGSIPEILTHIGATYDRPEHFPAGHGYVRWDSGLITSKYTNLAVLERYPQALERVSRELADRLNRADIKPRIIIGAEKGSIRLSDRLGQMMGAEQTIFAEKGPNDTMIFDRHEIPVEMLEQGVVDVVICEDIISRGGTVEKIIQALKTQYGERVRVVGVASVGRNTVNEVNFGAPLVSLVDIPKPSEIYYDDTSLHNKDGVQKSGEICARLMQHPEFPHDPAFVGSGKKYVKALQKIVHEGRGHESADFDGIVSQKA